VVVPLPTGPATAGGQTISDHDYAGLADSDRNQYARVRRADGQGNEWRHRDSLGQGTEPPTTDKVLTADGREGIRLGDRVFASDELAALAERAAAEDVRKASLPADPSAYRLELPADLVLPQGVSIEFQPNDPILGPSIERARAWAHSQGLSQEQFSSMLGLYAGSVAHERDTFRKAIQREIDALGPAGTARVTAVSQFLRAELGEELAAPLLKTMVTEKHVRAYETWINKRGGNVGGFTRANSEPPPAPGLSDAQYAAMSARERYAYAQEATARAAAAPPPRGGRA
jgi:hypothetical protein